jgi:hypothetical protein
MEIETWTDKVLESNKRKKDVVLSEQLLQKLCDIPNQCYQSDSLKLKSILYLAASVIIVLGFNLFSWITIHQTSESNGSSELLYYFNYINKEL